MAGPTVVRLTLERVWKLYACPSTVTPTDERLVLLGDEEISQIVATAIASLETKLEETRIELYEARTLVEKLQEVSSHANRDRVLQEMTNGKP